MTFQQGAAFAIVGLMMLLFVWGRLRYDVVAMLALFMSVLVGIVPAKQAFSGFADDVVVIVATALLISAAIARSGVAEQLMRPLAPYLTTTRSQVLVLVLAVIVLSTFIKNVGALAIMMPLAFQFAKRTGTAPSQLLMPLATGSLIGGLITLVGTSPNVIVSRVREEILGQPFRMFDYAPVGIGIAIVGLVYLVFAYRLLPADRRGGASLDAAINIDDYVVEARVGAGSPLIGTLAADVPKLAEGEAVELAMVVRERFRRYRPTPALKLQAGDVLLLEGEPDALEQVVSRGSLELAGQANGQAQGDGDKVGVIEGVVGADSPMLGQTPAQLRLRERLHVDLLALSRSGERITRRLASIRLKAGDVVVLQGELEAMPEALRSLGVLPLAERSLGLGRSRSRWLPVAILAVAIALVIAEVLPIAIAFFGAALAMLLTRSIALREAYEVVEWPILVLLGALIPVSEAVRTTGATDLIAGWLTTLADLVPPMGALALILVAAMAVTPFLNNAATVLMMAPIAASLAAKLGLNPDPFLMAVAVGSACDFLTPFGHQCNTLVMGPGGYRFGDYARLGLPLSILVVIVGVPLIALVWRLSP